MESLDQHLTGSDLKITSDIKENLVTACKWSNFLAIMGFIGTGLMAIGGIFMFIAAAAMPFGGAQLGIMGFVYLLIAGLYLVPTLNLFKFARRTKSGIESTNQEEFENGIQNLKSLFKFTGIMTIVVISLYILIFIIAAVVAGSRSF
jgi:hypothetical protein